MSQLTFDGFSNPPSPSSGGLRGTGEPPVAHVVSGAKGGWYQGRVLSHSSISTYRSCPQRWKFRYIDKVPEKPRSFFSFGKSVHAGLEFLFEKINEPRPSVEDLIAHYKTNWLRDGYETAAQEKWFYQEGERILRGFYVKHEKDAKNVFQVEYKFTIQVEGVPVTGFIDRIDSTEKGGLAIVDYKTGKAFDKSRARIDPQLTLYQIACQEIFQKPVETVTLYHLNSLTPLTVPAHPQKLAEDFKATVVEAAKGIADQKFEPKPDERGHCQWCDYMQICPAFAGRKIASIQNSPPTAWVEMADRFGKLDSRIQELTAEKNQLGEEIETHLRAAGKSEIGGKYFSVKLGAPGDEGATRLAATPLQQETNT